MIDWEKSRDQLILLSIFLLFIAFRIVWEGDMFRKPDITHYRNVNEIISKIRNNIFLYIIDEKQGVNEDYIVTNAEDFVSGLKETLYKPYGSQDMRKFFDDESLKILIQENVCYLRVDLDKVTHHISRSPSTLKKNMARFAASRSQRFKSGSFYDMNQVKGPFVDFFWGKPDFKSLVLFNEEMNDLYVVMCAFKNTPPLSLGEIP